MNEEQIIDEMAGDGGCLSPTCSSLSVEEDNVDVERKDVEMKLYCPKVDFSKVAKRNGNKKKMAKERWAEVVGDVWTNVILKYLQPTYAYTAIA